MSLHCLRLPITLGRGLSALFLVLLMPLVAPAAAPFTGITSASKFVIYYGSDYSTATLNALSAFNVVVIDPNQTGMTPSVVAYLHNHGVAYVLGYISIGEDAASVASGTGPITGDGLGPVNYNASTGAIVYENRGIASFYVDQSWVSGSNAYVSDGAADTNPNFGGYYIWPNAAWRTVLNTQQIGSGRSAAGLAQIAGTRQSDTDTNRKHNYGFDGFFLDTLDTSGPYDDVDGYYPWTAQEMSNTVAYIHNTYPGKMVLANRGLFFYNPAVKSYVFNIHPYDYDIRPYVNGALFESYYLDSGTGTGPTAGFNDNSINYAPKITAEANRADGFTVFSLDYAMNRGTTYYNQAIQNTIVANGWTEYLSADGSLSSVNTYVSSNMPAASTTAPVWGTTGAPGYVPPGSFNGVYPPRVGAQGAISGSATGEVNIQWDVALDQGGPVTYNIYQSTNAAFVSPTSYDAVPFSIGTGWNLDPTTYFANQYQVSGLTPGVYYFRVRAEAEDNPALEDTNTNAIVVTVVPGEISNPVTAGTVTVDGSLGDWVNLTSFGTKPDDLSGSGNTVDWENCWMAHDGTNFYIAYQNQNGITLNTAYNIFLDTDNNRGTGYTGNSNNFPVGADYLIQGTSVYQYTGSGGSDWNWTYLGTATSAANGTHAELSLPRALVGNPTSVNLFFWGDNISNGGTVEDYYPIDASRVGGGGTYFSYTANDVSNPVTSGGITVDGTLTDWNGLTSFGIKPADVTGTNNNVDWAQGWMADDAAHYYIAFTNQTTVVLNSAVNIFMHTDSHPSTGYIGSTGNFPIGGNYLLQGTSLYQYGGSGTDWNWIYLGPVAATASGTSAEFSFAKSLIGNPPVMKLFFYGDNTVTGGTGADTYPQTALTANGTGPYFVYRTGNVSPVDQWTQSHFTTAQLANPSISGYLADPDGDGLPNLMEYALGLNPLAGNTAPITQSLSGGYLALTFTRVLNATDITYHVQSSGDLVNWSDVWTSATVPYTSGTNASARVTVTDTALISGTNRRFMRLEVTKP